MNIYKISIRQIILIIIACRFTTGFIYLPLSIPPANQDLWIAQLLSIIYTFVICSPLLFLSNKFEDMSLIKYSEKIMGSFLGKIVGILYIALLVFICIILLAEVVHFMKSAIIPETPAYAIMMFALIPSIYTAYKGVETLGKLAELLLPFVLIIIIIISALNFNNMDFKGLLPIFSDSGFLKINFGAFNFATRFYEIIIICMLAPNVNKKRFLNKILFVSLTIFVTFLVIITVSTQGVLGVGQANHANFPYFIFAKQVDVFDVIHHIESLSLIGWIIIVLLKLSTYLYTASEGMSQIFGTKSYKAFIIPIAFVSFLLVLFTKLSKQVISNFILSYKVFTYITFTFVFVIPLILLIVYFARRKSLK